MADLSDPAIDAAYQDVRSDKSDTNWLLLDYASDRSDTLVLTQTGAGGLAELRRALADADARASFAYVRVRYACDKESRREKFVFVKWIGRAVRVLRRAKVSVQAGDVKAVLRVFSVEVDAGDLDQLDEDALVVRLRKAGGASYDGV